jgi:hypothetical protein
MLLAAFALAFLILPSDNLEDASYGGSSSDIGSSVEVLVFAGPFFGSV